MWFLVLVFFIAEGVSCQEISAEEYYTRLPQLAHLDDYDRCLSMSDGIYCTGTFRIQPNGSATDIMEFIKEYSKSKSHFDRTILQRGICVSSRCPDHLNTTYRFEKCMQTWASDNKLNVSLVTHFCRRTEETTALSALSSASEDPLRWMFLIIVLLLLILNILGTVYNLVVKEDGIKNKFWTCWSLKHNFKELREHFGEEPEKQALAPIQGLRVILLLLIILIHVVVIQFTMCLYHPHQGEQVLASPLQLWFVKCTSIVQIFLAISSFLTAYNLLLASKKKILSLKMLPKQMMKRYFRIAPVHLFFVGFSATVWPLISDGPMWMMNVDVESRSCRKKLWAHLFHINNVVEVTEYCMAPSWSLAADFQLQWVSVFLTLFLAHNVKHKWTTLGGLLVASCGLNTVIAHATNLKPLVLLFDATMAATIFRSVATYAKYYMSPWGSLSSCLIGLIMAYAHFELRQKKTDLYNYRWLVYLSKASLPLLFIWILAGQYTKDLESSLILALYVSFERPVFSILTCLWLFGLINGLHNRTNNFLCWRGWLPLGRLSLSVLMVHWVVIVTMLASRPQLVDISVFTTVMNFLTVSCLSYIIAVPVTLLVELPVINTYSYITSSNNHPTMSKINIKEKQTKKLLQKGE